MLGAADRFVAWSYDPIKIREALSAKKASYYLKTCAVNNYAKHLSIHISYYLAIRCAHIICANAA